VVPRAENKRGGLKKELGAWNTHHGLAPISSLGEAEQLGENSGKTTILRRKEHDRPSLRKKEIL